ncbi:UNVERIFIED_ORG: hypothetical protein ABIC97_005405 [Peribacillus simplex]
MLEMSEFWGFAFAPYLSIIGIPALSLLCLYIARSYVIKV